MQGFWSSGILTGNQTHHAQLVRHNRFWSSGILTGNQTNMLTGVVQYRRWQMQGLYDAEQVTYIKARVDLKDWERKGIDALAKKGKKVVVPEEDPDAPANIDLKVDGALWELKNVTNVSSSVGNQLGRSRKKWWKFDKTTGSRTIFTMYDCKNSAEEIAEAIKKDCAQTKMQF